MLEILDKKAVSIFLKIVVKEINNGNTLFVGYRTVISNGKRINAKQALLDIGINNQKEIWSHKFKEWQDTKDGEIISYNYAPYLDMSDL